MNTVQRRKIKRNSDLKLLFFTFVGAFILFFAAFTYLLPIITPKVEIPALSEERVLDSITSNDFRGRIDPRLRSIEIQEEIKPEKPEEKQTVEEKIEIEEEKEKEPEVPPAANMPPPKPNPIRLRDRVKEPPPAPVVPVYKAKVVVGDFSNPKEVKIASDILISLNYEPFIREKNGKYMLQIASFRDIDKAEALVGELKRRNFEARVIYE